MDVMQLTDEYSALERQFARRTPAGSEIAADLTQEVYLGILRRRDAQGSMDDPKKYLYGVAAKKYADWSRATKRERGRRGPTLDELRIGTTAQAADRPLHERELRQEVERRLRRLTAVERAVVRLRYLEELPNREVARRLDLEPAQASRIKYRALRKMGD